MQITNVNLILWYGCLHKFKTIERKQMLLVANGIASGNLHSVVGKSSSRSAQRIKSQMTYSSVELNSDNNSQVVSFPELMSPGSSLGECYIWLHCDTLSSDLWVCFCSLGIQTGGIKSEIGDDRTKLKANLLKLNPISVVEVRRSKVKSVNSSAKWNPIWNRK